LEAKYITRILGGDMRIGLSIKSIFDALSIFLEGDKKYSDTIERAYGLKADLGSLGMMIKENGILGLDIHPVCGVPVASKLVEREKDPEAIIKRMGECFVQPKYDGLRVQIHYNKKGFETINDLPLIKGDLKRVKIFSRNMEDLTMMLPDVIKIIETLDIESIILDGEAIGVDKISGLYMSFQDTIKRKRKYDIDRMSMDYPLQVNVFDIIELNGEDMTNKALRERLLLLKEIMNGKENNMFKLSDSILVRSSVELKRLFKKYTDKGLEGIVAKEVDSSYDPGTRNYTWIKLKASSNKDMVDSVDAVIMGYYFGEGNRNKLGFGALLAGVYDKNIDKFVSLAKVGTGLTEKGIEKYKEKLDEYIVNKLPKEYLISKGLMPDVLVMPKIVISIEADSISKSKTHGGGYSLRFPRLIEFGRDRDPFDTTSIVELEEMAKLKN
jgi:DNA ligase-1